MPLPDRTQKKHTASLDLDPDPRLRKPPKIKTSVCIEDSNRAAIDHLALAKEIIISTLTRINSR